MPIKVYPWIPPKAALELVTSAPIKKVLGCASWGCVFLLTNGQVLKVTSDDDEVAGVQLAIKFRTEGLSALPGIVEFFSEPIILGPFPWKDKTRSTIYAYEREAVRPLLKQSDDDYDIRLPLQPRVVKPAWADQGVSKNALAWIDEIGTDIVQNRLQDYPKKTKAQKTKIDKRLYGEYLDWVEVLAQQVPYARLDLGPIAATITAIAHRFYVLHDVNVSNMGMAAAGYPKLFDFNLIDA